MVQGPGGGEGQGGGPEGEGGSQYVTQRLEPLYAPKINYDGLEDAAGMFVLESMMGEGTFSQVFRAKDKKVIKIEVKHCYSSYQIDEN